ncbi:hypothetical protein [Chryseobacterium sp. LAM-KRS1]|uniref:hypothetical protein n=1 Tax=Chryseobacterium sp. LAM-KRS1 TaxID=2715754 RepID=UPI001557ED7C|nr:hypothetical protein [Chryseobacterium sp. LAM-KRS1]
MIAQPPGGPDGTGVNNIPPVSIGEKNINQLFIAPEVSQLLKVNFIPMNLYTGRLNLEIPLYEIKTGEISVPVSLKYNSEGIKIEEESSNVGAGWVLQAGGSISKMVRDIEDRTVYLRLYSINSSSYSTKAVAAGSLTSPSNTAIDASKDLMPDLFITTAPGLNSKFYFTLDSNDNILVKEIGNKGNKIIHGDIYGKVYEGDLKSLAWVGVNKVFPYYNNQARLNDIQGAVDDIFQNYPGNFSDYASFNITNPQGTNYKFKTSDINVAFPTGVSDDIYYFGVPNPFKFFWAVRGFMMEKYNINKGTWHLDEITDIANKKVSFEYLSFTSSNITKYPNTIIGGGTVSVINEGGTKKELNGVPSWSYSGERNNDFSFYSMNPLYHYVSKIKWDNGEVEFLYEKDREDILGKKALSKIKIKDKQLKVIKEYSFVYNYLSPGEAKRLKLERIDIWENGQQKPFYELSYYENSNLPSRKSFKKDFFGFYNNNSLSDDLSIESYIPKLYFVRGRKNLSITPFNVTNSITIPGGIRNVEANNYSSTGLLKSIKSITGGYNEFIYESNIFRFYGQDILGGGSRILSQLIKEGGGAERKIKYKYVTKEGNSSGTIANLPKFGSIGMVETVNGNDVYHMGIQLRSSSNIELTDGAFVGYERVIEEEEGKGYVEYLYTSPKQFPNIYSTAYVPVGGIYDNQPLNKIIDSSFFPGDVFMENDKTGRLLTRNIFDNNSNLLNSSSYQYMDKVFELKNYNSTKQIIRGIQSGSMTYKYDVNLQLINSVNLLSSEESIDYFNGKQIKNATHYTYGNTSNPFLTSSRKIDSTNKFDETTYKYAFDKSNQLMIDKNMIAIPLETMETKTIDGNSKTLSKTEIIYPKTPAEIINNTAGLVLPISINTYNLNDNLYRKITYDAYDTKGNLLQYTTSDGIPTAIIWGYNQTLPIVKIVGGIYPRSPDGFRNRIPPALVNNLMDLSDKILSPPSGTTSEQAKTNLLNALDDFRKNSILNEFQISTYTYDPLIGITSITQPSGIREVYIYDSSNRLKEVRQNSNTGKLIKAFKYNYKN